MVESVRSAIVQRVPLAGAGEPCREPAFGLRRRFAERHGARTLQWRRQPVARGVTRLCHAEVDAVVAVEVLGLCTQRRLLVHEAAIALLVGAGVAVVHLTHQVT